ncbi:MAG: transposase [Chloroflexi bacterium]|nr:transposase [Chloroflexota bacterium]
MGYNPHKHHRRSIRLKGYDYTQAGAYFITICVKGGLCVLGDIIDEKIQLNEMGGIVQACWDDLPNHYSHVDLDAFAIMPNHIHGIIVLDTDHVGAGLKPAPAKRHGLPEIVRALKTFSSRRINSLRDTTGTAFWQRNYYEQIIRNERHLTAIRQYILNNPINWKVDKLHPQAPVNKFNQQWQTLVSAKFFKI